MQQDQRLDDETTLNGLDRLTQRAALAISRRGFLKRLTTLGATLGVGIVATTQPAAACTDYYYQYRTVNGSCGTCIRSGGGDGRRHTEQRRRCRGCASGEVCDSWVTLQTTCSYC